MKRSLMLLVPLVCASTQWGQVKPGEAAEKGAAAASAVAKVTESRYTGDFDGMVKRRLIRVLTPYSKTGYFVHMGVPRGTVYDVFKEFEKELNLKQKSGAKVSVMVIPTPLNNLQQALLEGRGDIVAASALITEQRLQQVDFTSPTMKNVSEVIVTGPGAAEIPTIEDLSGKTLYLARNWAYWKEVRELSAKFVKEGKAPVTLVEAPNDLNVEDLLEMTNAGIVPATAAHDFVVNFWQQVFPKLKVNSAAAVKTGGELAWAIRKDSPMLKARLNEFLKKYAEGTAARNSLLVSYLKNTKYAREATSGRDRARLENLRVLFQKYGDKYGLDYLLMAAQGYQESALNQNAKSSVGAIGVMQLMAATGKDMNVGDISEVEPNIHAGVKYVRFMIDKFYGKEPDMTPLNKGLFTFASYNAGPGRIAQMRKLAAERGLDPNVWFNNVEVVTAEKVGAEPVTYVSNIYKYYLGYKMISEQRAALDRVKSEMKKGAAKQ